MSKKKKKYVETCENSQVLIYRPPFGETPSTLSIKCAHCGRGMYTIIEKPITLITDDKNLYDYITDLSERWHAVHSKSTDDSIIMKQFVKQVSDG